MPFTIQLTQSYSASTQRAAGQESQVQNSAELTEKPSGFKTVNMTRGGGGSRGFSVHKSSLKL